MCLNSPKCPVAANRRSVITAITETIALAAQLSGNASKIISVIGKVVRVVESVCGFLRKPGRWSMGRIESRERRKRWRLNGSARNGSLSLRAW
jgi:hypothetical protein